MREIIYLILDQIVMAEIASKRNKGMLDHEGHLYWFDKLISGETKKSWRCAKRLENTKKCSGRVYTDLNNGNVEIVTIHAAHDADAAGVDVARAVTTLKRRAANTQEIPSQLRTNILQNMPLASRSRIPNKSATDKVIHRSRNAADAAPAHPIDRASIVIPDSYQEYEYDSEHFENFLLADSGVGDMERILIFGRGTVQNWIGRVQKIYVDGTFSLAPSLFSQVFVIMAERGGFVIPILYALLPNKQEETYDRMIQMIQNAWPEFSPHAISMDYELAVINAFTNAFPHAEPHGCLFHLVKNVKRKLAAKQLMHRYNTESNFALQARMIPALAFIPIDELGNALDALRGFTEEEVDEPIPSIDVALIPVLDYFEDNYVGRLLRKNRRAQPKFKPQMWSCYERTLNDEARTNNYAEAAHRRLQAEFGVDHPTLWKFIDGLRTVQKSIDQIYEEFVRGDEPPRKRNKYQQADARILTIVEDFENREMNEYLRGIASNFTME